ncbi:TIGR02281 family clan AA aspartic protease [Piscinibacter sp. HJYY11]|uniref:retropepsin-like aspartic protease family protein n=1 Tax=Piscinibacter sp. HJYY11 TaxID=2801333 RepID=UPI00191CF898|nr:retropepsin-like aspartic protease [Piscinibacter sp. HJYY11]MBL0727475.1 retroviral-like aspartic protease family protein [Piscinibacter sp. HJYY11]
MNRCLAALVLLCAGVASAQTVSMSGRLGDKALLMIDGSPRTVAVGATVQGVKLASLTSEGAVVELAGKRYTVPMGGTPVSLGAGGGGSDGGTRVVLTAGSGGHFMSTGAINGKPVEFMVDTGATTVALSAVDADRIGLKYKDGQRGLASTAGGVVPVYRVNLTSVRVGEVTVYGVDATVVQAQMPFVLLGNSFLSRFQMTRVNDMMTLEKRP